MSYQNYLQSEWWLERRKLFKSKTWNRCFICRAKNVKFNVHHKRYKDSDGKSILGKEKHTDLRLLCEKCHHALHKSGLEEQFARNLIKRRDLRDFLLKL